MKCAWLENYLVVETDGWTRPCCLEPDKEARISRIDRGILNSWNDLRLLKLRKDLENGFSNETRPFCNRCETLENLGQPSTRNTTQLITSDRTLKIIQFKISNRCQLTCAHCGPELSSGWKKFLKLKPLITEGVSLTDSFLNELGSLLPQLDCLKFTGGEPFLDPTHWKILEYLKSFDRSKCTLYYITNGISPVREELWQGWKSVNCDVSVDGFEESYEWFRRGSNWIKLINNVEYLKKISTVNINFAITPYTIQDYFKANQYWKNMIVYPIVKPKHASIIDFPLSEIKKIKNYESIPFINLANGNNTDLYVQWANYWDKKWGTPGFAENLFYWMKKNTP